MATLDSHRRGRSRLVSPVALARQASEERRRSLCPPDDDAHRRQRQRTQRLRVCETLWEDERNRLQTEKQRAAQRREHDHQRARLRATMTPNNDNNNRRVQDPFQYAFMLPSKPPSATLPSKHHSNKTSPGRQNRLVSFKDVVNAMNGPLFPLDTSERADEARRIAGLPIPNSPSHPRKPSVRAELLDSLLQVVEWQQGQRRKAKGKDVLRDQHVSRSHAPTPTPVPSLPSSPSVIHLSSSPSSSHSSSWLTLGSWRSTATDITTPDSPVLASPSSSQPCLLPSTETQRERHPHCAFVRISVEESPLCPSITSHQSLAQDDGSCATPSCPRTESLGIRGALVKRVTRSVATIIVAAKGLQSAYVTATMFAAGPPYTDSTAPSQPHRSIQCQWQARREGYRALAKDVLRFTDATTSISQTSEPVHFIPLVSQPSGTAGLPKLPVPKNAVIFPSPLRPRTPPAALAYRMRPVANPAVLRLRALQNLMYARGKEWEGRAREGGLGCGKERMLGIAFEGRGRSGLGCEVRFVVA